MYRAANRSKEWDGSIAVIAHLSPWPWPVEAPAAESRHHPRYGSMAPVAAASYATKSGERPRRLPMAG